MTAKHEMPASRAALVNALDTLVEVLASPLVTGRTTRNCLLTCRLCRNRLLYLLDTVPYTGGAREQFTLRLRAIPEDHRLSHQNPDALDHAGSRFPQIRGLA